MRSFILQVEDDQADLVRAALAKTPGCTVAEAPPYSQPGPYEIALAMGPALAATGRYDTPGAAWTAAWASVPEFFQGRDFYITTLAPVFFGHMQNREEANGEAGE